MVKAHTLNVKKSMGYLGGNALGAMQEFIFLYGYIEILFFIGDQDFNKLVTDQAIP